MGKNESSDNGRKNLLWGTIAATTIISIFIGVILQSWILGILALLVGVVAALWNSEDENGQQPKPTDEIVQYRPSGTGPRTLKESEFFCRIAGAQYRNNTKCGFIGYVQYDPTNPHDSNAIAIYRHDGKLMGYIPREEQRDYKAWTDRDNVFCIGYITRGYEGFQGNVKVVDADRNLTEIHTVKFTLWLINRYGLSHIPDPLYEELSSKARTKEEWISLFETMLEELQEERARIDKERKSKS